MDNFMNLAKKGFDAYQESQNKSKKNEPDEDSFNSSTGTYKTSGGGNQQGGYNQPSYGGNNQQPQYGQGNPPYGGQQQQYNYGGGAPPQEGGYGQHGSNAPPQGGNNAPSYGGGYGGQQQQPQHNYGGGAPPQDGGPGQYGANPPSQGGNNAPSYGGGYGQPQQQQQPYNPGNAPSQGQQQQWNYGGAAPSYGAAPVPDSHGYGTPPIDERAAISTARHGKDDEDDSLFSSALSFIKSSSSGTKTPVDESQVTNAHQKAYGEGNTRGMDAHSIGSAAALQAFKSFTSGGAEKEKSSGHGGGDFQTKLIGMAMAEAAKLFDKSGGASSGNKQDAVNGAAATVMKLMIQSKLSGGGSSHAIGGSNSGGLGGLLSLASQFTKK